MSHFTVMVVGDDVDEVLAPFHEFECTGKDDEYVQNIDETEEMRTAYESETTRKYRDPQGGLHDPYEDRFYREPTSEEMENHRPMMGTGWGNGVCWTSKDWGDGLGYRAKVHFVPDGWDETKVPTRDCQTFAEFLEDEGKDTVPFGREPNLADEHKYGYALVDAAGEVTKVIDRTNPNKKWDWYSIGGRWGGFFTLKDGTKADQARKSDIDFVAMSDANASEEMEHYRKFHEIVAGRVTPDWVKLKEKHGGNIDAARTEYQADPVIVDLRTAEFWFDIERYLIGQDEFIELARHRGICSFAFLRDGQWFEKGEMGWWASVSNEKAPTEWSAEFARLLSEVPDDALLTIVDCHI